jgi:hypothetical protein
MPSHKLFSPNSDDYLLIGIVCACKDYKLAWLINKELKINLIKQKPIELEYQDEQIFWLHHFIFHTTNGYLRLLPNKCEKQSSPAFVYLLPEYRKFDFFLQIDDKGLSFDVKSIISNLKSLDIIQYLVEIEPIKLRVKETLMF